ncbi:MAG: hypothetical protein WAN03_21240 [Candidatus Sulfotelmatobacter sp.]
MKKRMFIRGCIALGLAAIPAYAQGGGVEARIPFQFSVNGKTLPAGEYKLTANANLIQIEDAQGKPVARARADYASGRTVGATGEIIFHCYRDVCLLAEIWSPVKGDSRKLSTTQTEARLAKEDTGKYFAVIGKQRQR